VRAPKGTAVVVVEHRSHAIARLEKETDLAFDEVLANARAVAVRVNIPQNIDALAAAFYRYDRLISELVDLDLEAEGKE